MTLFRQTNDKRQTDKGNTKQLTEPERYLPHSTSHDQSRARTSPDSRTPKKRTKKHLNFLTKFPGQTKKKKKKRKKKRGSTICDMRLRCSFIVLMIFGVGGGEDGP